MEDFGNAPLPLNAAGKEYFSDMIKTYADIGNIKKKAIIQFHTGATTLIALGLFVQFLKVVRMKAMNVHRWTGRATILGALLATPSFFKLVANQIDKAGAMYAEYPIAVAIPYFGVKGWVEIRNKDIASHRASMIMFAASFFFFGLERMVMALWGPTHSGVLAQYMPLGDWHDWTKKDYNEWFNIVALFSVPVTSHPGYLFCLHSAIQRPQEGYG